MKSQARGVKKESFKMSNLIAAFVLLLVLTPTAHIGLPDKSEDLPTFEVAFCNFPLPASIKRANASFYVSYSFVTDESGKPEKLTMIRNDYVDDREVSTCLKSWVIRGVQRGTTIVAIFRWEHARGWVDLSIAGAGVNQKIKLTGDRCPYWTRSDR